jgi:predicted AlkP superfamily phosphohydrolase/phosphomutase
LYEIRINEILADAGLLVFKSPATRRARARVRELKQKVARRFSSADPTGNVLERKVHYGSSFLDEIDFKKTRAYFAQDKGVWVNIAGRESEGIVPDGDYDDVRRSTQEALQQLVSPFDSRQVFERVMVREEAFNGAWSDRLPDIVMIPRDDRYVYNERPGYGEKIVSADSTTGTHARDGILIAWGSGVEKGAAFGEPPLLRDIGPTALASLGCKLPDDLDGRPLLEVFTSTPDISRSGSAYRKLPSAAAVASVYSEREEAQLKDRLRALGYIE